MTSMAVFTIGANQMQILKMAEYARNNWTHAGNYTETKRLVDDAKARKFSYVLVSDFMAIDASASEQLKSVGVEIIPFKDQKALERAMSKEKIKKDEADRKNKTRADIEKDLVRMNILRR